MTFENASKTHFNFIDEDFSVTFSYLFCFVFLSSPSVVRYFRFLFLFWAHASITKRTNKTNWSVFESICMCVVLCWFVPCNNKNNIHLWMCTWCAFILPKRKKHTHIHPLAYRSALLCMAFIVFFFSPSVFSPLRHLRYRYRRSLSIIWSIWPGKFHSAEVQTME